MQVSGSPSVLPTQAMLGSHGILRNCHQALGGRA